MTSGFVKIRHRATLGHVLRQDNTTKDITRKTISLKSGLIASIPANNLKTLRKDLETDKFDNYSRELRQESCEIIT